jgi:sec-independent protein translocase protein TatA
MFGIGMLELVIILVIIMIIFGANKLPQMGAGLAKGIRNFKRGIDGKEEIDATPKKIEDVK